MASAATARAGSSGSFRASSISCCPLLLLALAWVLYFPHNVVLLAAIVAGSLLPFALFRGAVAPRAHHAEFLAGPAGLQLRKLRALSGDPALPGGNTGGAVDRANQPDAHEFYLLQEAPVNYSVEFYSPVPVRRIPMDSLNGVASARGGSALVFAPARYADTLTRHGFRSSILQTFPNFHISQLTGEFLDARTRRGGREVCL